MARPRRADELCAARARRASRSGAGNRGGPTGAATGTWSSYGGGYNDSGTDKELTSHTDADGRHRLAIAVDEVIPRSPASFQATATVQDVNRQAWSASTAFLVHPARYYVGLRPNRWFAEPGQPFDLEVIVPDLDGKLVAGVPVTLAAERQDRVFKGGQYVDEAVPAGGCTVTSAAEPVTCTLTFEAGGSYRVTATIRDPEGRENATDVNLWTTGGDTPPLGENATAAQVEVIPDRSEYQPGDTARLLVRAPFAPAEGLVTVRRDGLVSAERFHMAEATTTLDVPITETSMPNAHRPGRPGRQAPRLGADGAPGRRACPALRRFASGTVTLAVPPKGRTLTVEAVPAEAGPGPGGDEPRRRDRARRGGPPGAQRRGGARGGRRGHPGAHRLQGRRPGGRLPPRAPARRDRQPALQLPLAGRPGAPGRGRGRSFFAAARSLAAPAAAAVAATGACARST